MLALAGATYQGVFRNPLADPYLLGVAAGAGLGATIAIAYLPEGSAVSARSPSPRSPAGSSPCPSTYAVGRSARRERDAATLVLAGVTVAAFFTAWQTFVQQRNSETLQQVYTWILGTIPSTGWSDVALVLPYFAVATVVILALRRVVDVLNLGDDEAASLGVHVQRVRLALVIAATLGTAAVVAVSGLIGFVGIIVPHAIRLLAGVGYRALLPLSVICRRRVPRARGRDRAHGARRPRRSRSAWSRPSSGRRSSRSSCARPRVGRRDRALACDRRISAGAPSSTVSTSTWGRASGSRSSARTAPARRRCCAPSPASSRSRGSIVLDGRPASELRRSEISRLLAVVPQEPSTPPWMTVGEYVLMGRTPHLGPLARESSRDREAAARAVTRLDLVGWEERRLGTLSGGEKQRVVVARALAQEARIVLLDEPTAALDIGHQQQALELLDLLRAESGLTLVAAMHDLTLAAQYAERMVLLDAGRIVAEGAPADVLTETLIASHYGASIDVVSAGDRVAVIPRRSSHTQTS